MTTRTELIARLRLGASVDRDRNNITGFAPLADAAADMLEADSANDDLTIAYMSGFKAGEDKYKAAARLALDALESVQPQCMGPKIQPAKAALKEVL